MKTKPEVQSPGTVERCVRCIVGRHPTITSDAAPGTWVCPMCLKAEHEGLSPLSAGKGRGDIAQVIETVRARGKGQPYDCLIGMSGGRDSTYLAYLLTREHGLRCLAAYYRTPFTHQAIDDNVGRTTKKLGIELVEIDVSQKYHAKIARQLFLLWKRNPLPEFANLACAPCKLLNREVFRIARSRKIRSIVFGVNPMEAMQFLPTYRPAKAGRTSESLRSQTALLLQTEMDPGIWTRG